MPTKTSIVTSYRYMKTRNVPDTGPPGSWSSLWVILQQKTNSVTTSGPVPGYKDRIANYVSATTPLSGVRWKFDLPDTGRIFVRRFVTATPFISGGIESEGMFSALALDPPDPSNFVIGSVSNQAAMRLVSQIRAANTSLKGMVTAGEFGESVRLVNSVGKGVFAGSRGYLNDVSQLIRLPGSPQQVLRRVAGRWLEFAFGIKPLLADLDDGIRAIRRFRSRPPRVLVRASAQSAEKPLPVVTSYNTADHTIVVTSEKRLTYGERLYGCVALTPGIEGVAHEFGFKPDEFAPTVWELLPFSFLSDYFINIGAIIDFYSLNSSGVRWLNRGRMSEGEILSTAVPVHIPQPGWTYREKSVRISKPFRITRRSVSREAISFADLSLSLQFRIPGSSTQWLNMGALAAQHERTSRDLRRRLRV